MVARVDRRAIELHSQLVLARPAHAQGIARFRRGLSVRNGTEQREGIRLPRHVLARELVPYVQRQLVPLVEAKP